MSQRAMMIAIIGIAGVCLVSQSAVPHLTKFKKQKRNLMKPFSEPGFAERTSLW